MEDEQAARWTLQGPGQGGRCRLRPKRHSSHRLSSLMVAQPAVCLPWPRRGGHQAGARGHTPTCPGTESTRDPPAASGQKLWFCFKFLSLRKLSREQARGGGQGQGLWPGAATPARDVPRPQGCPSPAPGRSGGRRLEAGLEQASRPSRGPGPQPRTLPQLQVDRARGQSPRWQRQKQEEGRELQKGDGTGAATHFVGTLSLSESLGSVPSPWKRPQDRSDPDSPSPAWGQRGIVAGMWQVRGGGCLWASRAGAAGDGLSPRRPSGAGTSRGQGGPCAACH